MQKYKINSLNKIRKVFGLSLYYYKLVEMLIFNTTLHLDDSVHDECLEFLKTRYIPTAIQSGLLGAPSLARIESVHEENGTSYALQFKTGDIDVLNRWADETGELLKAEMASRFGTKVAGFVTLLEEISLR